MRRPSWRGYLGIRTLIAFVAIAGLGLILLMVGALTTQPTLRGVGTIFLLFGAALSVDWASAGCSIERLAKPACGHARSLGARR